MKSKSKEILLKKTDSFAHENNNRQNISKINPWSLLEDYPNTSISASSFAGEKYPRSSLRYANSILNLTPRSIANIPSDKQFYEELQNNVMIDYPNSNKRSYQEFKEFDSLFVD